MKRNMGKEINLKLDTKKKIVKENLPNKIIINNRNRIIHKDNIKF